MGEEQAIIFEEEDVPENPEKAKPSESPSSDKKPVKSSISRQSRIAQSRRGVSKKKKPEKKSFVSPIVRDLIKGENDPLEEIDEEGMGAEMLQELDQIGIKIAL